MQVQVEMYPDRLVIRNPGGLYGPVEVGSLGTETISSSRNKALLKILEDTPYSDNRMVCENRGSGIARIRIALVDAGMESPRFTDDISSFTAEFPNHTLIDEDALNWLSSLSSDPLSRPQMTALVMMRNGEVMTNSSYRAATGVQDSRAASRDLKDLVDRGIVEQVGTRGSTVYTLAGQVDEHAEELLGDFAEEALPLLSTSVGTEPLSDLQNAVLSALGSESLLRHEIEERTGLDLGQVKGALKALRDKGRVELVGKARSKYARWRAT
jgi:ATP-dependent DNA helicase RecG